MTPTQALEIIRHHSGNRYTFIEQSDDGPIAHLDADYSIAQLEAVIVLMKEGIEVFINGDTVC